MRFQPLFLQLSASSAVSCVEVLALRGPGANDLGLFYDPMNATEL